MREGCCFLLVVDTVIKQKLQVINLAVSQGSSQVTLHITSREGDMQKKKFF